MLSLGIKGLRLSLKQTYNSGSNITSLEVIGGYITSVNLVDTSYSIIVQNGIHAGTYEVDAVDLASGPYLLNPGTSSGINGIGNDWTLDNPGLWIGLAEDGPIILSDTAYVGTISREVSGTYTQQSGDSDLGISFVVTAMNAAGLTEDTVIALVVQPYVEPSVLFPASTKMVSTSPAVPSSGMLNTIIMCSCTLTQIGVQQQLFSLRNTAASSGHVYLNSSNRMRIHFNNTGNGVLYIDNSDLGTVNIGDRIDVIVAFKGVAGDGTNYSRAIYKNGTLVISDASWGAFSGGVQPVPLTGTASI